MAGWNRLGAGITTLGNGFTIKSPSSGSANLAATACSAASGKRYWEFIPIYMSGGNAAAMYGIGRTSMSLATYIGATTNGVGNNNQNTGNNIFYNATQIDRTVVQGFAESNGPPNFLGVAMDTAASKLYFYTPQNGLWYGTYGSHNANIASVTGIDISGLTGGGTSLVPALSVQSATIFGGSFGDFPPLITGGLPSGWSMWNSGISAYTAGINFLNPSEKSGFITLAQSNLRAWATSGTNGAQQLAVGNLQVPNNCRAYWEHRVDSASLVASESAQVGVRRTGQSLTNSQIEGGSNVGIGYYRDGAVKNNGTTLATIAGWHYVGDIIGIAVDTRPAVRKVWFSVNGVFDGDPAAGTGGYSLSGILGVGAVFPAIGTQRADRGFTLACNFGGYARQYSPPSGFVILDGAALPVPAGPGGGGGGSSTNGSNNNQGLGGNAGLYGGGGGSRGYNATGLDSAQGAPGVVVLEYNDTIDANVNGTFGLPIITAAASTDFPARVAGMFALPTITAAVDSGKTAVVDGVFPVPTITAAVTVPNVASVNGMFGLPIINAAASVYDNPFEGLQSAYDGLTPINDGAWLAVPGLLVIPTIKAPYQITTVNLANQRCRIHIYQKEIGVRQARGNVMRTKTPMFVDLYVNDALVIGGVIGENGNPIVRDTYLGFIGDLQFIDTQRGDDPLYTGLGERWVLTYWPPGT